MAWKIAIGQFQVLLRCLSGLTTFDLSFLGHPIRRIWGLGQTTLHHRRSMAVFTCSVILSGHKYLWYLSMYLPGESVFPFLRAIGLIMRYTQSIFVAFAFLATQALAENHDIIVGTFSHPRLYTVRFDDEALTLNQIEAIDVPYPNSWISLSARSCPSSSAFCRMLIGAA